MAGAVGRLFPVQCSLRNSSGLPFQLSSGALTFWRSRVAMEAGHRGVLSGGSSEETHHRLNSVARTKGERSSRAGGFGLPSQGCVGELQPAKFFERTFICFSRQGNVTSELIMSS